jgi:hypothetical protein
MSTDGAWLPIPENWSAEKYDGLLPKFLYRYRQLSPGNISYRVNFEVLEEAVFLAGAGALNDPDEGRIQWRIDGTRKDAIQLVAKVLASEGAYSGNPTDLVARAWEIAENMLANGPMVPKPIADGMHEIVSKLVRIVCFTDDPLNQPMWAHYGKHVDGDREISNGGLCIEYEVQDSWRGAGLHPVEYRQSRPTINMLLRENLPKQFAQAMRVKSEGWSYEREWRITSFLEAAPPWPDNLEANSKLQLSGSVRSVIFGLATPSSVLEEAVRIIRAKNSTIRLMRVQRSLIDESLVLLAI